MLQDVDYNICRISSTDGDVGLPPTKKRRTRRADGVNTAVLGCMPPEIRVEIVRRLAMRDYAAARLAARPFNVLTVEEHARICHGTTPDPRAMAREGCLEGLAYFHSIDPWRVDAHCLREAAAAGHLDVVRWIMDRSRGGGCPTMAFTAAAGGGHTILMRWLHEERGACIRNEALAGALAGGHLDAVRCLRDLDPPSLDWDMSWALAKAAASGNVALVDHLWNGDPETCRSFLARALEAAAENGRLECAAWLLDRSTSALQAHGAFQACLQRGRGECGEALLARWPKLAVMPVELCSWHLYDRDDMDPVLFEKALAVVAAAARGCAVDGGPGVPPPSDPPAAGRAPDLRDLLAEHLATHIANGWDEFAGLAHGMALSGGSDDLVRWLMDVKGFVPSPGHLRTAARQGQMERLRLYHQRGHLLPVAHEVAMGAAEGGRLDVLDRVWSLSTGVVARPVVTSDADGTGLSGARAIGAHAQAIADCAADSGEWAVVEWLRDRFGRRAHCTAAAFHRAAKNGHARFLERLYEAGADRCRHLPDADTGCAPCEDDISWQRPVWYFGMPSADGLYECNALWRLAREGHADVFRVISSHGGLGSDHTGHLHDAILSGHLDLCALLVSLGRKPCRRDLELAVRTGDVACMRFLIQASDRVTLSAFNTSSSWMSDQGPLVVAAARGDLAMLCLLLDEGLACQSNLTSALFHAQAKGHRSIMARLRHPRLGDALDCIPDDCLHADSDDPLSEDEE